MSTAKRCAVCGESKPLRQFFRSKKADDGYRPECCACSVATPAPQQRTRRTEPFSGQTKACKVCGEVKAVEEFYRAKGTVDGRRGECRDCFQMKAHARKEADQTRKRTARE